MTLLPFPQGLEDKYQPKRLKDFIGIPRPLAAMKAFVARPYASAWFLIGASGAGKTSMALAVAREVNAELHHIPSQKCTVDNINDVCSMCLRGAFNFFGDNKGKYADWHLVLTDEADRMLMPAQLNWLSKLDSTAMPPKTVFIFTANSAQGLEDRFLSRCRILIFEQDSFEKDLPTFLAKVYKLETRHSLPLAIATKIARDNNYNVRSSLMELEVCIVERAA